MKFEDLKFESDSIGFMGMIHRAHVEFENGNGLSVVHGAGTYSSRGTYEIAPLHEGGLFHVDNWGDSVLGHVTREQINKILEHAENDSHEDFVKFLNEM